MTIGSVRYKQMKDKGIKAVTIRLSEEEKAELDKAVRLSGESQNTFILYAIKELIRIQREQIT